MKRALYLVVPLALTLVACSDDDDAPDVTAELDVSVPDLTVPDVTRPDLTVPDISLPDLTRPDLSLPDLTLPDFTIPDNISIPDLSIPENAAELIEQVFPQLDEEQIDCLVDAAEEVGGSVTDPGQLLDYLEECNVDASDLLGGG